jgi:hypothetical protein
MVAHRFGSGTLRPFGLAPGRQAKLANRRGSVHRKDAGQTEDSPAEAVNEKQIERSGELGLSETPEEKRGQTEECESATQGDGEPVGLPPLGPKPCKREQMEGGHRDAGPSDHKQEDLNRPSKLSCCGQLWDLKPRRREARGRREGPDSYGELDRAGKGQDREQ